MTITCRNKQESTNIRSVFKVKVKVIEMSMSIFAMHKSIVVASLNTMVGQLKYCLKIMKQLSCLRRSWDWKDEINVPIALSAFRDGNEGPSKVTKTVSCSWDIEWRPRSLDWQRLCRPLVGLSSQQTWWACIAWTVYEIIYHLLFSWLRSVWPWMNVKVKK